MIPWSVKTVDGDKIAVGNGNDTAAGGANCTIALGNGKDAVTGGGFFSLRSMLDRGGSAARGRPRPACGDACPADAAAEQLDEVLRIDKQSASDHEELPTPSATGDSRPMKLRDSVLVSMPSY